MSEWERFTGSGKSYAPKVSIWNDYQIALNAGSYRRYDIDDYKYAILFYNTGSGKVGIKLTNNGSDKGAMKLHCSAGRSAWISGESFLMCHGLDHLKGSRFPASWNEEQQMIVFDPEEAVDG